MGCLWPKFKSKRNYSVESDATKHLIETQKTNETSLSSSISKEDRAKWVKSQSLIPDEAKFFSSEINLIDFQTIKLIGRGGYSKVYLVWKKASNEFFAMKVIHK